MRPWLFAIALFVAGLQFAAAQDSANDRQSGYLNLQMEDPTVKKDPYKEGQLQAIEYVKAVLTKTNDLKNGNISPLPSPSGRAIHHLTGVYLFCTLQKGACPEVLDTLLEGDLVNSRIAKNPRCPTLLSFWKDWQDNDMEKRQNFLLPVGFSPVANAFSRDQRPRYLKCADTIKDATSQEAESDSIFFKTRYSNPAYENAISMTLKLHEAIAAKIPNIFAHVEASR